MRTGWRTKTHICASPLPDAHRIEYNVDSKKDREPYVWRKTEFLAEMLMTDFDGLTALFHGVDDFVNIIAHVTFRQQIRVSEGTVTHALSD
jgi:hypothetical protein